MTDIVPASKTTLKIFIASSAEVKEERDKCVLILNELSSAHQHLEIKPVLWEYDMPRSNYPGHTNIQDAINQSALKDCPVAVFIFFSKIGKYTKEEFEHAAISNKRVFIYFKDGFTPNKQTISAFSELLDFQERLDDTVLYEKYKDLADFERKLYINLNLYFSQTFTRAVENAQNIEDLKTQLAEQEKLRKELEQQLVPQTQSDALKQQALEEIKKGDYEAAEEHLKQSAKDSINDAASTFFELGNIKKLQLLYKPAYEYFELATKIDQQNPDYSFAAGQMAQALGLYDAAMEHHQKSLVTCIALFGEEDQEVAVRLNNIGLVYRSKGEYDKAIEYHEGALTIDKMFHNEEDPYIAILYNNLGLAFHSKAEYDKAIKYYEKALAIGKKFYGEEHPDIATRYNNLGGAYYCKGEYGKAIEYYEKALAIGKKFYGEEHPDIAIRYNNLGGAYQNRGEYGNAINYYDKALVILKKIHGQNHPYIGGIYNNLGVAYHSNGFYDKAIEYYEKALAIAKKFHGEEHPNTAIRYNNLGLAYRSKGEHDKAIEYYEKAIAIKKIFFNANHPSMQLTIDNFNVAVGTNQQNSEGKD